VIFLRIGRRTYALALERHLVNKGDKVVVIEAENEYFGLKGTMTGLTKDGRVLVTLDNHSPMSAEGWTVSFEPHDIDLAE
jgi:hypothetical protein